MNNSFDWGLVRAFLAALDRGSLLGAARALGMSQPTVGRHIAQLEAQVGGALFERTGRGLRPTALAQRLAPGARAMQEGATALAQDLSGARQELAGTVRLSASQPVACYLLPTVLARLRRERPAIEIELVVSNAVSNLDQQLAQLEQEGQRVIDEIRRQSANPLDPRVQEQVASVQQQVGAKRSELEEQKRQVPEQQRQVRELEMDQIVDQGQIESTCEVRVGDNLVEKLQVALLVRDGVIEAIEGS